MDVKKELKEYTWIRDNIKSMEDRLYEIDMQLQSIGSIDFESDRVISSKDPDVWTNSVHEKIELEKMINKELCESYKAMRRIESMISELPEREKLLLRLKYIDGLTWEEVCVKMNYSWRQTHRIHSEALKALNMA